MRPIRALQLFDPFLGRKVWRGHCPRCVWNSGVLPLATEGEAERLVDVHARMCGAGAPLPFLFLGNRPDPRSRTSSGPIPVRSAQPAAR